MSRAYLEIKVAEIQDAIMVRDYFLAHDCEAHIEGKYAGFVFVRAHADRVTVAGLHKWAKDEEVFIFSTHTSLWRYE